MKTNIYFIESGKEIKIGRSIDIERRLDELQTSNSKRLKVLYVIEDVEELFEKHIHSICTAYHVRGEWFEKDVLNHLLKHPFFIENMKPYSVK